MRARGHAAFHLVKRGREDNAQGGMRIQGPYTPGQQGRRFRLAAHAQLRVTGPPGGPRPGTHTVRRIAGPQKGSASRFTDQPGQLSAPFLTGDTCTRNWTTGWSTEQKGLSTPSLRLFQSRARNMTRPITAHPPRHRQIWTTRWSSLGLVRLRTGRSQEKGLPRIPAGGLSGRSRGVSGGRDRAGHAVRSGAARPAGRPGLSGGSGGAAGAASGRPARPARAGKAGWPAARSARGP